MDETTEVEVVEADPRVAAHHAARLEVAAAAGSEQMIKTSGWLVASLLVINGGGAVATLQIADKLSDPRWPLWAFGAGLVLAMLSAVVIQGIQTKISRPTEELILAWRLVELHGHYRRDGMVTLTNAVTAITRFTWVPPAIGWVSAAAFIVGGTWLTQAVPSRAPAVKTLAAPANGVETKSR